MKPVTTKLYADSFDTIDKLLRFRDSVEGVHFQLTQFESKDREPSLADRRLLFEVFDSAMHLHTGKRFAVNPIWGRNPHEMAHRFGLGTADLFTNPRLTVTQEFALGVILHHVSVRVALYNSKVLPNGSAVNKDFDVAVALACVRMIVAYLTHDIASRYDTEDMLRGVASSTHARMDKARINMLDGVLVMAHMPGGDLRMIFAFGLPKGHEMVAIFRTSLDNLPDLVTEARKRFDLPDPMYFLLDDERGRMYSISIDELKRLMGVRNGGVS